MYIDIVPNRNSPPAVLLRESVREGHKIRKRTVANLSSWQPEQVEALRRILKGERLLSSEADFRIERTRPHGHVAATLGTLRKIGLDTLLFSKRCRERDLVEAMIVARILEPGSKLAMARGLGEESLFSTLGEELGITDADENDLYEAMDWVRGRQEAIETRLVKRHLREDTLVLYDVTTTYFEGRTCPLGAIGHAEGEGRGKLQIQIGMLCERGGRPVAVEVFGGEVGDPKTFTVQVKKMAQRFGLKRVVYVGDRGTITQARIREDLKEEGLDWITALRSPAIRALVDKGAIQRSFFDTMDMGEIKDPAYPGERLIVCLNGRLAEERRRKREDLLAATQVDLEKIVEATRRRIRPLKGKEAIGVRVGKVIDRHKVGKHFILTITEEGLQVTRDEQRIREEAALDGMYVIRTSVESARMKAEDVVLTYKGLSVVERAFRSLKSVDLHVRPIHHRTADRVRAHVFLCMLAYYVEWHMRQALAPILFDDAHREEAQALRESGVAPARRSTQALRKATAKRTDTAKCVHSFQTLLKDLRTLAKNRCIFNNAVLEKLTRPTPLQQKAFDLLGIPYRL